MSDETSAAIAGEAGLLRELAAALNRHSVENESDTPDFVLAEYARTCLDAFASATRARDKWAGRAAASPDLDAIKREAAREALTKLAQLCYDRQMPGDGTENYVADHIDIRAFRDREYPAPVPEPPHVMVNGWRVTWNDAHTMFQAQNGPQWEEHESATALLARIGMGWLQVDSFAVRVLALREGRGDDA